VNSPDPRRQLLLELFRAGLARVDGRSCVRNALTAELASRTTGHVWIAAIGKAASSMVLGAHDALGTAIERTLVITKDGHVLPQLSAMPGFEIHESAHPVPDERSLAAGARLLRWVDELPQLVEPLFLVSGGSSSLVEVLEAGTSFADLERLTARGLAEGIDIGELNARRSRLSLIKGGRLAARLNGRAARALFISDVPGDDPAVIGSGLLGPAVTPDRVERTVVASIDHAMESVAAAAAELGLEVGLSSRRFDGDVMRLAVRFAHELHLNSSEVQVWGGESTVQLPEHPGRGGRNQHLALAAARHIAGHSDLLLLAAGTDGTDGATDDAGALVDAETCARLALVELDADLSLERADSGTALAATGDLVHTGPTGTNVGDLVIGLKLSADAARSLQDGRGRTGSREAPG
jgi:glycerate 2-kinase